MRYGLARFVITLMSIGNLFLAASIINIGFGGYSLSRAPANPENLTLLLATVMLALLTVYYIVKVIWRDKYLNLDSGSGKSKLVAALIMFVAGFSTFFVLKLADKIEGVEEMWFEFGVLTTIGIYMFVVTLFSAVFVSGWGQDDED